MHCPPRHLTSSNVTFWSNPTGLWAPGVAWGSIASTWHPAARPALPLPRPWGQMAAIGPYPTHPGWQVGASPGRSPHVLAESWHWLEILPRELMAEPKKKVILLTARPGKIKPFHWGLLFCWKILWDFAQMDVWAGKASLQSSRRYWFFEFRSRALCALWWKKGKVFFFRRVISLFVIY